jgi:hypothetical protein
MKYYLKFDETFSCGTAGEYFHFLLGYLIPALNTISLHQLESRHSDVNNEYILSSCGPVMDQLFEEAISLYECHFVILDKEQLANSKFDKCIKLARWDLGFFGTRIKSKRFWKNSRRFLRWLPRKSLSLLNRIGKPSFAKTMPRLRDELIAKTSCGVPVKYANTYLILRRSAPPQHYQRGSYGNTRRDLLDIDEALVFFRENGVAVEVFEPGQHSFAEQIQAFATCRGVIGVRGAEFANLVWMKPGSENIYYNLTHMSSPAPARKISKLLHLVSHQIDSHEAFSVKIRPEEIMPLLEA